MLTTMLRSSWAVIARPSVANFEEHERNQFGWALLYVTLGATVTALLGGLAFLIQRPFLERQYADLFAEFVRIEVSLGQDLPYERIFLPADAGNPILTNVLNTLFGFLVYLLIVFLLGKALGGSGKLGELAYDIALFWVPISVAAALVNVFSLGLFACFTAPLAILITFYGFYLTYLSVQSGLNLSARKALTLVLIPALLWLLAICSLIAILIALAGNLANR